MKKIIIALSIFAGVLIYSQQKSTGINTSNPLATLDVNGDFNKKNKLFLDDGAGLLLSGSTGHVLVSRGAEKTPVWKSLRVPDYEPNQFYLIFNDSFKNFIAANGNLNNGGAKTGQGITFTSTQVSSSVASTDFVKSTALSTLVAKNFKVIGDLTQSFIVNSSESKTYFLFETVVQHDNSSGALNSSPYACGIFVDKKLESIRINSLVTTATAGGSGFTTHTQIGGVDNLEKGSHTVDIACGRLATTNAFTLGIGSPATNNVTNLNNFMTQSSLKIDVYEIPQNFNSIIKP